MSKHDIVLVKPGSQKQLYGELSSSGLTGIEPPLWAALLAGYLREKGCSVVLYDAEAENWSYEETAAKIKEADPILAAVVSSGTNPSASTMNMTGAGKIVSILKELEPSLKTMLLGLHPSALPGRTLTEESPDFVCQGEAFHTIPDLLETLKNKDEKFTIDGLWYKKNQKVCSNPFPQPVEDLGSLPRPAWDLLPMEKYRAHNWHCFGDIESRRPYAVLYTSLGCPFDCGFCCINAFFGKRTIRYRPIDDVINELDFLVNTYGVKHIKIIDEMFAMNEKRVIELCDRIIEKEYDLNMWAYARVNTVTERMLTKMKDAGINWLAYGFESGSKRVIDNVTKNYDTDDVKKIVKQTREAGINICANYIFGLPEDDYDTMNETLDLMSEINAEWANIYCAMAYPGSRLYEDALEKGWSLPESWQDYSQYSYKTLPLATKYLTGAEVLEFRDKAFHEYFSNARYLGMINKKFGAKTVKHIKNMAKKKLKRRHIPRSPHFPPGAGTAPGGKWGEEEIST